MITTVIQYYQYLHFVEYVEHRAEQYSHCNLVNESQHDWQFDDGVDNEIATVYHLQNEMYMGLDTEVLSVNERSDAIVPGGLVLNGRFYTPNQQRALWSCVRDTVIYACTSGSLHVTLRGLNSRVLLSYMAANEDSGEIEALVTIYEVTSISDPVVMILGQQELDPPRKGVQSSLRLSVTQGSASHVSKQNYDCLLIS